MDETVDEVASCECKAAAGDDEPSRRQLATDACSNKCFQGVCGNFNISFSCGQLLSYSCDCRGCCFCGEDGVESC